MSTFLEEQAKRLYGLGELEREALEVLRLVIRQTERGENFDADLIERAKAIIARHGQAMMRGHEGLGVILFARSLEGSCWECPPMAQSGRQSPLCKM